MRMVAIPPGERLAPLIRQFTAIETDEEVTRVLVPDAGIVMGLRYSGSASLLTNGNAARVPDASFAGMRDTVRRMRTSEGGGILLAVFREGGAAPLVSVPLDEFFGDIAPLDVVLPRGEVEIAADRVRRAAGLAERVAVFEEFLLARLDGRRPDDMVVAAVRAIRSAPGSVRVAALAARLGLSQDGLEKRFRRAVGTTPKKLATILRLRGAVEGYRPGISLTRLSADAGFSDQSHFNRDVRSVTGEAPGRFFGSADHC